jgi:molybdopterin-guanine dinucleotide biosynthesis protein A
MTYVTGIVLAGGASTRFGSDKLAAEVEGSTLLQRAVSSVGEVAERVVVVLAPAANPPVLAGEVAFVHDALEGQGPLQGVLAGLSVTSPGIAVIVGGDMPFLSPDVLRELVRLVEDVGEAAVLQDAGARAGYRPLPMAVSSNRAAPILQGLLGTGVRSLYGFAEALHPAVVPETSWTAHDPERGSLRDVDEPSDLGMG